MSPNHQFDIKAPGIVEYKGKNFLISDEEPKNGDLVLTTNYGVWVFRNDAPAGSNVCYAPLPYWANKNACKKLVEN